MCQLLIQHDVNMDARNINGKTPLHQCQSNGGGVGVAEVMLAHSPELIDQIDRTALFMSCEKGNDGMVRLLLSAGVDPNRKGPKDRTPLLARMMAEKDARKTSHKLPIVEVLLRHGADPKIPDKEGKTALMDADDLEMAHLMKWLNSNVSRETITPKTNEQEGE
ncbi:ankyrin repeat-containing domain protein [Hypoxylon sp. FL0543]|nr:ankyrin repeat-containing domain protein [Hypoxylon sp. FL0543]